MELMLRGSRLVSSKSFLRSAAEFVLQKSAQLGGPDLHEVETRRMCGAEIGCKIGFHGGGAVECKFHIRKVAQTLVCEQGSIAPSLKT